MAQDGKGPYKGPSVGMQQGRGHIDLSQNCALEPRERKAKLEPFKCGRVHE